MAHEISESLRRLVLTSLNAMTLATPGLKDNCVNPPMQTSSELVTLKFGSSIAFLGHKFHGCLAVSCTQELVEASHPSIPLGLEVGADGLADWCGEITNQVMGRIKNQLSDMNIQFTMDTPIPLPPEDNTFEGPNDCQAIHLQYMNGSVPLMKISFWIDDSLDGTITGVAADAVEAGNVMLFSTAEGDAILF